MVSNKLECWAEIYLGEDPEKCDLHQEFADLLGVDRQSAKEECYKIMFSSPFLKLTINNLSKEKYLA